MRPSLTFVTAAVALAGALAIPFTANVAHVERMKDVAQGANNGLAGTAAQAPAAVKPAKQASATKLEAYKP